MGRVKLEIKKIENASNRQVTYSKRKQGLTKKASELATLCDTDVALIMFSPTGRLFSIPNGSRIEDIIYRFANVPEQERHKRKQESLEILNKIKRSYSNEAVLALEGTREGETSTTTCVGNRNQNNSLLILQEEVRRLQYEHNFLEQRLRIYQGSSVGSIQAMDDLSKLEEMVQLTLVKVNRRKQELINNNLGYMMQPSQSNQMQAYGQMCPVESTKQWVDIGAQYAHRNYLSSNAYVTRQDRSNIKKSSQTTSFQEAYASEDTSQISAPLATQMLFNLSQNLGHEHQIHHNGIFMEDSLSYVKEEHSHHLTHAVVQYDNTLSQSIGMGINVGGWQQHSSVESGFSNHFLPRSPTEIQQEQDAGPTTSKNQPPRFVYEKSEEKRYTL